MRYRRSQHDCPDVPATPDQVRAPQDGATWPAPPSNEDLREAAAMSDGRLCISPAIAVRQSYYSLNA